MTDVTETVKLFEIYQTFCCLDASNRLPVPITAIFMACTYYSCNFPIHDLRACSALISAIFLLRNPRKIRPVQDPRLQRTCSFRKSLKDSIRHFRFMLSPVLFRFLQSDANQVSPGNTIKVNASLSQVYCLSSIVCLLSSWLFSGMPHTVPSFLNQHLT